MNKTATKFTGTQVKELLAKAVGGIYIGRGFDVMTDFYNEFRVTDTGLEISVNKLLTANIPIQEDADYINFAVGCNNSETPDEDTVYEVWEDSLYFAYKFEISNYMLCFNTVDANKELTWEQFRELVANERFVNYTVRNVDGGSVYVDMSQCNIHFDEVHDSHFEVCSLYANMEIDKDIVDAIYNDATESEDICYRIEFNNGMSDMTIEPEKSSKVF